jgi:hypothetical protein
MDNVVSLMDRTETWSLSYNLDKFETYVSSRGRIKLIVGNTIILMDTIQSVDFMGRVSKTFEDEFNVLFDNDTH